MAIYNATERFMGVERGGAPCTGTDPIHLYGKNTGYHNDNGDRVGRNLMKYSRRRIFLIGRKLSYLVKANLGLLRPHLLGW